MVAFKVKLDMHPKQHFNLALVLIYSYRSKKDCWQRPLVLPYLKPEKGRFLPYFME
jgi:hypothetical protein